MSDWMLGLYDGVRLRATRRRGWIAVMGCIYKKKYKAGSSPLGLSLSNHQVIIPLQILETFVIPEISR